MEEMTMEKMTNLCKQYGYIYQGSEIYGGLANTWDYGPLGCKLKNNIKDAWREFYIRRRLNAYEIDADILMNPKVWVASGHVSSFNDPLIDCKSCKTRHRADNLIEEYDNTVHADGMSEEEMIAYIKEKKIPCPKCGKSDFTDIREFNLMFETNRGVIKDDKSVVYLRPENAQGEYVNYLNVKRTTRSNLPFSIGQVGKAFRNEITPGNFTFRTIEFEQMEYQTFCKPEEDEDTYNFFKEYARRFFMSLGIPEVKLRYHDHEKLAFYAKMACDIEYEFPFGWGEINGTHNRTDYDLSQHEKFSGEKMAYTEPETNKKYIPYIIESTIGVDRLVLAILFNSYHVEELENGDTREIMQFKPVIAPYKVGILPLIKKVHSEKAKEIYEMLTKYFDVCYDDGGSIGKRYRRCDIMGVPYVITVDDESLNNNTVTIRDRDTMEQTTMDISKVKDFIEKSLTLD